MPLLSLGIVWFIATLSIQGYVNFKISDITRTVKSLRLINSQFLLQLMKCTAFEKCCSLNIEVVIKTTVLFHYRFVKLASASNTALINTFPFQPYLPFEMRDFPEKAPFRKPSKTKENNKQDILLLSFLAIMTLDCVHLFCTLGRMKYPLIWLFISGQRPFIPSR